MTNKKLSAADYQIFLLKSLLWLGITWLGFVLALAGFFYVSVIWVFFALGAIGIAYYFFKNKLLAKLSPELWIVSAAFIITAIVFALFSTPTIFSGRDQGSISESAIRLAQNHSLEFSTPASREFFKIYGPGRALNFPGFYYTNDGNLITQFPLIYIVWLAIFYATFGLAGFATANAILLIIFFLSFYLLIRLFLKPWQSLPAIIFALTSFVFMWFSKFTLSENMALPLLWLSILSLMLFLKSFRKLHFVVFLASALLLFFTRIEGMAFLAISIIILFLNNNARGYIQEKMATRFFLPLGFFLTALIINTAKNINFYREVAKALLSEFTKTETRYLGALTDNPLPAFYFEKIFCLYGLLGFFIVGTIGILIHLRKKEFYKLIPFFITAPTLIYFFNSKISPDHPWMLRRFMFSLLPIAIFYSGLLLGEQLEKKSKKIFVVLCFFTAFILTAGNLPAFSKYLFFSENKTLLQQTRNFSDNFSDNDLILVDRETTGDGWTMISGPMSSLYGKNSAYFFNVQDLEKLDLQKFDNIHLVAPNKQIPYYLNSVIGNRMLSFDNYSFTFSKLDSQKENPFEKKYFPIKETATIKGEIFKIEK